MLEPQFDEIEPLEEEAFVEPCEPERREPTFLEPARHAPRRCEPLLSELLAAA
jgi:hypothetical protein